MTHDPMLDGIRRWVYSQTTGAVFTGDGGEFVLFSDLPALIARVREDERGKRRMVPGGGLAGYNEGYAAALDAAREAVAALRGENENVLPRQFRAQALAAIDTLREKP